MAGDKVCGKCGGPVVQRMPITKRNSNNAYSKKCYLCKNWFWLHQHCVKEIIGEESAKVLDEDETITPAQWAQSEDMIFRCRNCQTTCFVCFQNHKFCRERYISECNECKKKWCHMLPACGANTNDNLCVICKPIDTTKYVTHIHKHTNVEWTLISASRITLLLSSMPYIDVVIYVCYYEY